MTQFDFEGIGTKWHIDLYEKLPEEKEKLILSDVKKRIDIFDRTYSRFRDDSLVMKMSKESGDFTLPEDGKKIMTLYYDLYKITNGFFTPLVGNLLSQAGYDAKYSLKQEKELDEVPKWEEVILYEHPNIHIKIPAILDFGAGGKGYLVDLIAQVLEENKIFEYCINAGGDILHKGNTPIRVGLESPTNTDQVIGVYTLQNGSICGSAGNRRAWGNFTHIMNPKTLNSPKNILALWVVADNALLADSLATCLFFVPAGVLKSVYNFEYFILNSNQSIEKSEGFSAEIFIQ